MNFRNQIFINGQGLSFSHYSELGKNFAISKAIAIVLDKDI